MGEFIIQEICCYRCEKVVKTKKREKRTSTKKRLRSSKLCPECSQAFKQQRGIEFAKRNKTSRMRNRVSARMQESNPMFKEENRSKVSSTLKDKYERGELVSPFSDPEIKKIAEERSKQSFTAEIRQLLSEKMLGDKNPMKNPETCRRVQQTLKEGYESGRLNRTRGSDHWLWKGTSTFNKTVRSRLYPIFVQPVMERDNFTCQVCSKHGGMLHVHHLVPLRDIIDEVLAAGGVEDVSELIGTGYYDKLVEIVVHHHRVENGQTVCPKCHGKIDDRYRRKHLDKSS